MVDLAQTLSAKQRELLAAMRSRERPVILFGGGSGGGKSHGLRAAHVIWHLYLRQAYGVTPRSVLLAEDYPALQKRFESAWMAEYGPDGSILPGLGEVKGSGPGGYGFYFSDPRYGYISMMSWEKDPTALRGTEWCLVSYDESTTMQSHYGDDASIQLLRIGARQRGCPSLPLVLTSNWDGVGLAWHKEMFYDRTNTYGIDPADVIFLPVLIDDNPDAEFVRQYKPTLEALTGLLRDSRLLGIPTMPQGAAFAEADPRVQGFDYRDRFPHGIPRHWTRIIGYDWGWRDPFCALWHAIDPNGEDVYTYREVYSAQVHVEEQARIIAGSTGQEEVISRMYCDPAIWQRRHDLNGDIGPSVASILEDVLDGDARFPSLERGDNSSRVLGQQFLRSMLSHKGKYRWHIERGCKWLWSELTTAVHGMKHGQFVEDIDVKSPDHALTAAWYSLRKHLDGMAAEDPKTPQEQVEEALSKVSVPGCVVYGHGSDLRQRKRKRFDFRDRSL